MGFGMVSSETSCKLVKIKNPFFLKTVRCWNFLEPVNNVSNDTDYCNDTNICDDN